MGNKIYITFKILKQCKKLTDSFGQNHLAILKEEKHEGEIGTNERSMEKFQLPVPSVE